MDKINVRGFSLVELMVTVAIFTFMMAGVFLTLNTSHNTWADTDTHIHLQENLRLTLEKVGRELRESGSDSGTMQVAISDGTGVGGSDVITFSMPVVCEAGGSIIDVNSDVANWGAPLTWGCTDSTCMDADDDCDTLDYASVRYLLNSSNQLLRRVLNDANATVREDVFALNITDFQATLSGDENVVTLTITASRTSDLNRTVTATRDMNVFLRNRG